jgi:hypothetical protein
MGKNYNSSRLVNGLSVDASGNVGVGGSPSGSYKFEVTGTGRISSTLLIGGNTSITSTSTDPVGLTITGGDEAFVKLMQGAGALKNWGIITSNLGASDFGIYQSTSNGGDPFTAGTPKLYISGAGNVGIGTSSPANYFTTTLTIDGSSSQGIMFRASGTDRGYVYQDGSFIQLGSNAGGVIFKSNDTERMRITSGGNVGIGTSSPITNLHIRGNTTSVIYAVGASNAYRAEYQVEAAGQFTGSFIANPSASSTYGGIPTSTIGISTSSTAFVIATSEVERMRITSSGYTKMTNADAYLGGTYHEFVNSAGNNYITTFTNTSANPYGLYVVYTTSSPNSGSTNEFIWCVDSNNSKFIVWSNGNVVNRNNSYGAISDIKYKENIVDATPKLDDILKLKVRNFNFIGFEEKQIGFIAQEFEEVFPKMVDNSIDKESGDDFKSIKTSVLIPMLVKAIQELKGEVDSLKAQINN